MQPLSTIEATKTANTAWVDLPAELHLRTGSLLELDDIFRLSLTSAYHQSLLVGVHSHRLKVMLTKDFNLPVQPLVTEMQRLKAIIVGVVPLAILDPRVPRPYEIDFFVPFGEVYMFEDFILSRTPYRRIRHRMTPLYPTGGDSGIFQVMEFRDPTTARILRIIETDLTTATSAVFLLPTTVAMTYITWNAIVCPYPAMLAERVGLINSFRPSSLAIGRRFVLKYSSMGYMIYSDSNSVQSGHTCGIYFNCSQTVRTINDGSCLQIRWTGTLAPLDLIDAQLEWRLAFRHVCSGDRRPTGAYVSQGNGESIDVDVRWNNTHTIYETMTVVRLNRS